MQSYNEVKRNHKMWVEEELVANRKQREEKWTKSIAVGSREFVDSVKLSLAGRANGRKVHEDETGWQLREREPTGTYNAFFEDEKSVIGANNAYIWTDDTE